MNKAESGRFTSVAEYIAQAPEAVRPLLEKMRQIVRGAAPEATEIISYSMPAIKFGRILVYYAACRSHIGFYPTSSGIAAFEERWRPFKTSKGAVQIPLDSEFPEELITDVVRFRLEEERARPRKRA